MITAPRPTSHTSTLKISPTLACGRASERNKNTVFSPKNTVPVIRA